MEDILPLVIRGVIVGILIVTALAAAYLVFGNSKASTADSEITTLATGIQGAFGNQPDFTDLGNINCATGSSCTALVQANAIPANLIGASGLGNDPWGGAITIAPAALPGNAGSTNSGFSIQYAGVPAGACTTMLNNLSGYSEIDVGSTKLYPANSPSATGTNSPSPSVDSAACKGGGSVTVIYGPAG